VEHINSQKTNTRFAVVGLARTGSNFLLAGLSNSTEIKTYDEVFAKHKREVGKDFDRIYSALISEPPNDAKLIGFKLFYYHLTDTEWQNFLKRRDFTIIHLTRKNYLRTIVSLEIAMKTNVWYSYGDELSDKKIKRVTLDADKIVQRIEEIRTAENQARLRFNGWDLLEVTYEDLVRNPVQEFDRVTSFLSIANIDVAAINLRRQNPESLENLVENYNEISSILRKTEFSMLLES